jgi:PAS domain S-box-containing protein
LEKGTLGMRHMDARGKAGWPVLAAWAAGLAVAFLCLFGLFLYAKTNRERTVESWRGRLQAMADDRQAAIEAWLRERWGDARTIAAFPAVESLVACQPAGAEAGQAHLGPILDTITRNYGYQGIWVLDGGARILAASPGAPPLPPAVLNGIRDTDSAEDERALVYLGVRSGQARLGFLQRAIGAGPSPGARTSGWIFLSVDPTKWLYPLLQRKPVPTRTGEAVLIRKVDGDILFLTPLRFKKAGPLSFSLPLTTPTLAARFALQEKGNFGKFTDYRGVPVYAAVCPIRGTDWGLVVKADREEVLASSELAVAWASVLVAALFLAVVTLVVALWRQQRLAAAEAQLEERKRSEAQIRQLNRLLRTISEINQLIVRESDRQRLFDEATRILVEIGGFVMAWVGLKGEDGSVAVAAKAGDSTGYLAGIAVRWDDTPEGRGPTGTAIREGRDVIDTDVTLNPAMAPWRARAFQAGCLSSAAFPLRVAGEAIGAVTVYGAEVDAIGGDEAALLNELAGDLGLALEAMEEKETRRRAEEALRSSEERYRLLAENSADVIWVMDVASGRFTYVSPSVYRLRGYTPEEVLSQPAFAALAPASAQDAAEELPKRIAAFEAGNESERVHTAVVDQPRKDGTFVTTEVVTTFLEGPDGRVASVLGVTRDITERKRAEEALRAGQERFRWLYESMGSCVAIYEPVGDGEDFLIRGLNRAAERSTGRAREDVLGKSVTEVFPGVEAMGLLEVFRSVCRTGEPQSHPVSKYQDDEITMWAENYVFKLPSGEVVAVFEDVTPRVKAEAALRSAHERLQRFVDSNIVGVVIADASGAIIEANDYYLGLVGCTREEVERGEVDWRALTPPEWLPADENALKELREKGTCTPYEKEYLRRDGTRVPVFLVDAILPGAGGQIAAFALDLTQRNRAEAALRESEARYRSLFENNVAGVYRSELGKGLVECNEAFARIFGFASPAEALHQTLEDFYANPEELVHFRRRLVERGTVAARESHCRRKDGSTFWVLENATLVHDEKSGRSYVEGTCIDISELKRSVSTRLLLATAIEQSHDSVIITDAGGSILYVNPAFERVTGYSSAEAFGQNPRILKSGRQDQAFYRRMWETILAGEVWSGRLVNRRKDGSYFTEFATISPVRGGDEKIQHFVAVKRDITSEEELERQLVDAKGLETVGMIASGVAHEVRNPLFAISAIVAALEKKLSGDGEYGEFLAHIKDQSGRLNTLMNDLLVLGRPLTPEQFHRVLIPECLHEALAFLEDTKPGARSHFILELPEAPLPVWGVRDRLVQVFLNLLQNSLHFSPKDKPISVCLRRGGGGLVLTVRDEGPGVPPSLLPRLFEPFQTGRKGGTGLGLAIVRQIVLAHGGSAEAINNDPPPGATFTVRLPLAEAAEG